MPFWRHYYHVVWAAKERNPFIDELLEPHLYRYLMSKAGELGVYLHAIGGRPDHVHVVATIPPKHSVSWFVKTLKGSSAHFVNHGLARRSEFHFAWQRGYGSLTLGQKQLAAAIAYVERQEEHHLNDTVNAWLERVDMLDESVSDNVTRLRESSVIYDADTEWPF